MAQNVTPLEYRANVEKLAELIKDIKIAMLSTVDEDGQIRSRPMGTQQVEFDGDLWFFTAEDDAKVAEVQVERQVNVSYAAPDKNRYVSLSGSATLVRDQDKMEELWTPFLKVWFPDGLDDPNLALLKIQVQQAEYWEYPAGVGDMVATVIGFVQSVVTGEQADIGENKKLEFNQHSDLAASK